MRKKFLSAFMLGLLALGTTSTMVSCKDYDDDISSLKSQIKSLEDLIAQKEATINSSIANLQSAIDKANNDHATKAALQEAVTTLENAIKSETADRIAKDAELSAAIAKAQGAADAAANLAAENKEAIQKVAGDLATANEKIGTLSTKLAAAETKLGQLEAALEAQKTACENADAALKQEIDDLKKYVDDQDKALKEALQAEIQAVSEKEAADYAELKGLHETLAANVTIIEGNLKVVMEETIPALSAKLGELDVLAAALAKDLRSLVFIPNLYVDGIETIEYPFLKDTALVEKKGIVLERQRTTQGETYVKTIRNVSDWVPQTPGTEVVYGPAWPVDYHMNPANSSTAWSDVKGWAVREVETATRAAVASLGAVTSPEKYDNGDALFRNNKGILTAGIKIEKPKALLTNGPVSVDDPHGLENLVEKKVINGLTYYYGNPTKGITESATGHYSYGTDNIVALQVNTKNGKSDSIVTSDYAMLSPEVLHPEAIVWVTNNDRGALGSVDEAVSHSWSYKAEVKCPAAGAVKTVHVWDTPQEALLHTQGVGTNAKIAADDFGTPDILLPWDSKEGIDLKKMIGTHVTLDCPVVEKHDYLAVWPYKEEQKWGLHYEFEFVEYTIDGNATIDSRYATLTDGVIVANDVNEDGTRKTGVQDKSTIGREPLVRVMLKTADGKVLLDGYILVRISKAVEGKDVTVVTDYPEFKHTFNLCDAFISDLTTWAQFDEYVLTKKMEGMEKIDFDAHYTPDVIDNVTLDQADGGKVYRLKVFKDTKGNLDTYTDYDGSKDKCGIHTPHTTPFGAVYYYENSVNTTNHAFQVNYTEDELEYLTHDKAELPVTKTIYVRYKGDATAKYSYIYIKFDIVLDRIVAPETGIKEKNRNYWFGLSGEDSKNGVLTQDWDGIVNNLDYPNDAKDHTPNYWTWNNTILSTFIQNKVEFTNAKFNKGYYLTSDKRYRKFYFAPINTTVKDGCSDQAHDAATKHCDQYPCGKTWTITAKSSSTDEKWNAFVCHNDICCSEDHKWIQNNFEGYNHNTYDFDANVKWNAGISEYRPDYAEDCSDNLHKAAKYTTHKFAVKDTTFTTTAGEKIEKYPIADYAANDKMFQNCAIDYNDGCFTNDALYATCDGVHYIKIVELDQATGILTLVRPAAKYVPESVLDHVLNAIGYENDQHANVSKEMRTWVGVVANNGCDVAVNPFRAGRNNNSIFQASWQRPINLVTTEPSAVEDAEDNGEFIPVIDLLHFFDWRGPVKGDMEGYANKWLWGYYNIHRVTFSLDPKDVYTNMHQADPTHFVKLETISKDVHLYAYKTYNALTKNGQINDNPWFFDSGIVDLSSFSYVHTSPAINTYLENHKHRFGYIFYENNGENVTDFIVKIPVTVYYEWGHFDDYISVRIIRTQGN